MVSFHDVYQMTFFSSVNLLIPSSQGSEVTFVRDYLPFSLIQKYAALLHIKKYIFLCLLAIPLSQRTYRTARMPPQI
jgi:hypothetical protein